MHKSRPESASLAVLKSPDIPSILVETGFISNPKEERLLSSSRHQESIANAIYKGVSRYYHNNPPADTLLAQRRGGSSSSAKPAKTTAKASAERTPTERTPTAYVGDAVSTKVKHKVRRGESLSAIAQRYSVPMSSIKQANGMKSDVVQLGQTLVIPQS